MDAIALVFVVTLAFVVGSLRKRIGTLESAVMRLQGRLDDVDRRRPSTPTTTTTQAVPAPDPIDIEPFVD